MSSWINKSVFYHIYPLGALGAPRENDLKMPPQNRLKEVCSWLDHIQSLGSNALYLGPLFESSSHGYDTVNFFEVDRRLGTINDLRELSKQLKERQMRLVLDAVFNHVGRDFWAFKDLRVNGVQSAYRDWFSGVNFNQKSALGDPFSYDTWNGHYSLVKLNLDIPAVKDHLFKAVSMWQEEFGIDGLRLDAADAIQLSFLKQLANFTHHTFGEDFWLMGEVIHGDYRHWANAEILDSVTNYELYKGLYSSFNDHNFHELAYSLNRQFGAGGIYSHLFLYTFLDNHDVDRIASILHNPSHIYPLHLLLLTIPGIPSIYYGSEFGMRGKRTSTDDFALRPIFDLVDQSQLTSFPNLRSDIKNLTDIREKEKSLQMGDYYPLMVTSGTLAFSRHFEDETIVVVVNSEETEINISLTLPDAKGMTTRDLLTDQRIPVSQDGSVSLQIPPNWGRILKW